MYNLQSGLLWGVCGRSLTFALFVQKAAAALSNASSELKPAEELVQLALDRWQQRCLRADNTSVIVCLLEPSKDPEIDDVIYDDNDGEMSKSSSVVSVATTIELSTSSLNLKPKSPKCDDHAKAEATDDKEEDTNSNDLSQGRSEWAMEVEGVETEQDPPHAAQRARTEPVSKESQAQDTSSKCNASQLVLATPTNLHSAGMRGSKVNGAAFTPRKAATTNNKRRPRALSPLPSVKVVLKNIAQSSPDLKMQLQQETLRLNGKSQSAPSVLDALLPAVSSLVPHLASSKTTRTALEACQKRMQQQQQQQVEQARILRNHAVLSPIVPSAPVPTPAPASNAATPTGATTSEASASESPATRRRHNSSSVTASPRKQSYAQILSGSASKKRPAATKKSAALEKSKPKSSESKVEPASSTRATAVLAAVKRWKPVKRLRKVSSQKSTTSKVATPRERKDGLPGKHKRVVATGSGSGVTRASGSRKKLSVQKAKDILSGTATSAHRNKCRRKLTLGDIKKRLTLTLASGLPSSTASQADLATRANGKMLRHGRMTSVTDSVFSTKSCHNLRVRQHERHESATAKDSSNNSSNTSESHKKGSNHTSKKQHGRHVATKNRNSGSKLVVAKDAGQQRSPRTRALVASGKSKPKVVGVEAVAVEVDVITAEMMETSEAPNKSSSERTHRHKLKIASRMLGECEKHESGTSSPKQGVSAKSPLRISGAHSVRVGADSTVALPSGMSGLKRKMSMSDDASSAPGSGDESSETECASVAPSFVSSSTPVSQVRVFESSTSVQMTSSDAASRKARHVNGLIRHIQQRESAQQQQAILRTLTSSVSMLSAMTPAATKCSSHASGQISRANGKRGALSLTTEDLHSDFSSSQPLALPRRRHSNVGVRNEHATRGSVRSLAETNPMTAALHLQGESVSRGKRASAGSDLGCQGRVAAWSSPGVMTRKQRKQQQKSPHKASLSSVS